MACNNCFNGCTEPVSDKCVKYTGVDVPSLGIQNGDTLLSVENAIVAYLITVMNGTGIVLNIDSGDYCTLVSQYLTDTETVTALDLFTALIKAACDLQTQMNAVVADVATIEANYTIGCLSGVSSGDGTHAILQAVITKLCQIDTALTALALDVSTNYVKLADLNDLIAAYLEAIAVTNKAYAKMVPYTVVEYYGPLSNYPSTGDSFDGTGAGLNYWEKVYLCNGDNGTPDKRGRVSVGATTTPGVLPMSSDVNPATPGNPAYAVSGTNGVNTITLDSTQIPSHTHTATVNDPGHTHTQTGITGANSGTSGTGANNGTSNTGSSTTGIGVTISNTGGGLSHNNYQPGIGCYHIMYIP